MKTLKNRLFLAFVLVFAVAFSAFAVVSFGDAKKVSAADSGSFGGNSTLRLNVVSTAAHYDYVSFEYKFNTVDDTNRIQFVITESGDTNCYGFFIFDQNGGTNSYAGVTTEKVEDDYIKVTIKTAELTALRGNAVAAEFEFIQIQFYKNGTRSAKGSGTIRNASFYNEEEPEEPEEVLPEGTYKFDTNATINITEIAGTPSDTLSFEYKLTANNANTQFCLRNGGTVIVNYFKVNYDGSYEIVTATDGVTVSTESAEDDYYKVTVVGTGIVENTTRLYSNNGVNHSVIYIREVSFYNEPEVLPEGTYKFDTNATINITEIAGTPSDTLSFEYKLTANNANTQFCLRNGGTVIVNYFKVNYDGSYEIVTATDGVTVSTESAEDDYYKVTVVGAGIVENTTRLYSNNGVNHSVIYVRDVQFVAPPEYTLNMVEGASVRTAVPYGIRFKANVSKDLYEDGEATFGMAIIPFDWIERYSLSGDYIAELENNGLAFRKFDCTPVEKNGEYYIQASLTNIKESNIEREFIGIAWFERAGERTYAFNENCARSIKEVAEKAIIAGESFNEEQTEFVNGLVGRGTYNAGDKITIETSHAVKGEDILAFYYKKTAAGTVRFAVVNTDAWENYYGYFVISDDNAISAAGVTVSAEDNGWFKVTLDACKMTDAHGDLSAYTYFNAIYFKEATGSFEYMGLGVEERPAHADQVAFTAGGSHVIIAAPETAAYTSVSFDYAITTESGNVAIGVFNEANNGGYGYYYFGINGLTATGITCETLEDGYIHVVIDLTQTTTIFMENELHEFKHLYIRGKNSSASGYIDNVQWVLANS